MFTCVSASNSLISTKISLKRVWFSVLTTLYFNVLRPSSVDRFSTISKTVNLSIRNNYNVSTPVTFCKLVCNPRHCRWSRNKIGILPNMCLIYINSTNLISLYYHWIKSPFLRSKQDDIGMKFGPVTLFWVRIIVLNNPLYVDLVTEEFVRSIWNIWLL